MGKLNLVLVAAAALAGCQSPSPNYEYPDGRTYADFVGKTPARPGLTNEIVTLKNAHGVAKVSLVGANVFSYVPAGGEEVLFSVKSPDFLSDQFQFAGIPLVWPWFAANGEAGCESHGFVRQMKWTVVERAETANVSRLVLELVSSDETRRLWPYDFRLRYTVTLDDQLHLSLVTENADHVPFDVTEGFHAFYRVSDVDKVVLRGLDGCRIDSVGRKLFDPVFTGDLKFHAGEDRVFSSGGGEYVLFDEGKNRALALAANGHRNLILWSIPEHSVMSRYFSGDDWKHFVCLEPSTFGREKSVTVLPGKRHELRMSVRAAKLK